MIAEFTQWLIDLVIRLFTAVWTFICDLAVNCAEVGLNAIAALVTAIPAPSFLSGYSIGTLINQMPDYVLFFVSRMRIGEGLAIIAAGFAFRMVRKAVTLGQW